MFIQLQVNGEETSDMDKEQVNSLTFFLRTNQSAIFFKSKYEGEWAYDRKEGKGKLTYHNKEEYTGFFKDDLRHGKGTFTGVN